MFSNNLRDLSLDHLEGFMLGIALLDELSLLVDEVTRWMRQIHLPLIVSLNWSHDRHVLYFGILGEELLKQNHLFIDIFLNVVLQVISA